MRAHYCRRETFAQESESWGEMMTFPIIEYRVQFDRIPIHSKKIKIKELYFSQDRYFETGFGPWHVSGCFLRQVQFSVRQIIPIFKMMIR